MANLEKVTEPNHQRSAPIEATTSAKKLLAPDTLRKMIASGKSVPSKPSAE